jgi:hypothetical protein
LPKNRVLLETNIWEIVSQRERKRESKKKLDNFCHLGLALAAAAHAWYISI